MRRCLYVALLVLIIAACKSESENAFDADEKLVAIHDAQLTKDTTSLLSYLNDKEANYRARAAMLSGRIYSKKLRTQLESLLSDPSPKVRQTAAYALGQYGKKESLQSIKDALEAETDSEAKAAMLEAFGKCADVRNMEYLTNFAVGNDTAIRGWAYGMYRLGVFSVNSIEKAIAYYNQASLPSTKKALAFYLGDTRTADYRTMRSFDKELQSLCNKTADPIVKSYLISAQQSISLENKLEFLQQVYESSKSPIVRYRCVQQLCYTTDGKLLRGIARKYASDSSLHIRLQVMDWLAATADSGDADYFRQGLQVEGNELLLVKLFKGWLNATGGAQNVTDAILANAENFKNAQAKADLYALLGKYTDRYADKMMQVMYKTKEPVVGYRIMQAIKDYCKEHDLMDSVRQNIAVRASLVMKSGKDPALTYGAELLADTNIKAYKLVKRTQWLEEMIEQETKPRVEYALSRVLKLIKGVKPDGRHFYLADHANPDWEAIKEIPEKCAIQLETTAGSFTIDLFLENAPMSVWRFYDLSSTGFYDTSAIHRVVFPHVIQGGSQFGDGYTDDLRPIRTETTMRHFDEGGLVGFASDGRDTETGQFFITHLPRPHLDPYYTIFGKVTSGMAVVNAIQMGDYVLSAKIIDSP